MKPGTVTTIKAFFDRFTSPIEIIKRPLEGAVLMVVGNPSGNERAWCIRMKRWGTASAGSSMRKNKMHGGAYVNPPKLGQSVR